MHAAPITTMKRVPEAELMDGEAQAQAYANADFSEPHTLLMKHFVRCLPDLSKAGAWIDLGCGAGEITVRLAKLCPKACIDAVDGSAAMLHYAKERLKREGVDEQVRLIKATIPEISLSKHRYDGILSTSLLHHLHNPQVLWHSVKTLAKNNAYIFIADLYRPQNEQQVDQLVEQYAATEPQILQRDFRNSLCAAFTPDEIKDQLKEAGMTYLRTEIISDRHLIVYGKITHQVSTTES